MKIQVTESDINTFCSARRSIFSLKSDIDIPDVILCSLPVIKDADSEHNIGMVLKAASEVLDEKDLYITYLKGKGTFHNVYRIEIPTGKSCIMRTSIQDVPYKSLDFYIDKWAMDILKQLGIPCLQVFGVDVSRREYPFDYEIIEEAKGIPLNTISGAADVRSLLSRLGRLVADIHNIVTQGAGMFDIRAIFRSEKGKGLLRTWPDFFLLNLDKHLDHCYKMGTITGDDYKKIVSIFQSAQSKLNLKEASLLHGDLGNSNIFSDDNNIVAILDWEDSISGDPIFDIASWGTFIGNSEKRKYFLDGYCEARQLPADFEFRYWLYYLRIVLAKTVHRHRFKYDLVDRIPARQRILNGLERLEAV